MKRIKPMKSIRLLFLSVFLFTTLSYAERPTVVVFPFSGEGVSPQTARLVTERMRHGLGLSGRVRVLERDQIDRILETIGRNLDDCTEEGCGIEIGRQLDAEKIIVGEVTRIGQRITMLANYVDVATTEREISASKDLDGIQEERLTDFVPDLVGQIVSRIQLEGKLLALEGDTALVDIGQETGVTPGVELIVEVRKPVHDPQTGEIKGFVSDPYGRLTVVDFPGAGVSRCLVSSTNRQLIPGLKVRMVEAGAFGALKAEVTFLIDAGEVFATIDGTPSGLIPVPPSGRLKMKFNPGSHNLVFSRSGVSDWRKDFTVDTGERLEIEVAFESSADAGSPMDKAAMGILLVTSDPVAAMVFVDNVERGITPYQAKQFAVGSHIVEIVKPLYTPYRESVVIEPNMVTTVEADLPPNFGTLEVSSEPEGAMVEVDGQQRGLTPYFDDRFQSGNFQLRLAKPMFHDHRTQVQVTTGQTTRVKTELQPAFGGLRITTSPSGAEVFLDGRLWGETPMVNDTVLSGRHRVQLRKELYREVERLIEVRDRETTTVKLEMDPHFGELDIRTSQPGATVYIEGEDEPLGQTPLHRKIDAGMYRLRIEKDDYIPHEETVSLGIGDRLRITPPLGRKTGQLKVFSEPPAAEVYIDGRYEGRSPVVVKKQPTGPVEVLLKLEEHASLRMTVDVFYNEDAIVDVKLSRPAYLAWKKQRNAAIASSIFIPGKGQVDNRQKRGWIYFFSVIAGGWLSYDSHKGYEKAENRYNNAVDEYNSGDNQTAVEDQYERITRAHDDMKSKRNRYNIALTTTIGIWAVNMVDVILWGGGKPEIHAKRETQTSQLYFDTQRKQIGVRFRF